MKQEKGVTLMALTVYIIIFLIVLSLLGVITSDFHNGIGRVQNSMTSPEEFNKFNVEFVKDVKSSYYAEIKQDSTGIQIVLDNGTNYRYITNEKAIYRNQVKLSKNIILFEATNEKTENNKNIVSVTAGTGKDITNLNFNKTIKYVLRYW